MLIGVVNHILSTQGFDGRIDRFYDECKHGNGELKLDKSYYYLEDIVSSCPKGL